MDLQIKEDTVYRVGVYTFNNREGAESYVKKETLKKYILKTFKDEIKELLHELTRNISCDRNDSLSYSSGITYTEKILVDIIVLFIMDNLDKFKAVNVNGDSGDCVF